MKRLLFLMLLSPFFSTAQPSLPRFEKDTLYTSGGYKIYKDRLLHLASGTSDAGYFRFIKFHFSMGKTDTYTIQNSTLRVNKLKSYKYSGPDNNSIRILGSITYKDGTTSDVDITMNFERAIESFDGLPGELTVPEEFIKKRAETVSAEKTKTAPPDKLKKPATVDPVLNILVADEIKKLFDLYKAGALTKEEYDAQKKKLLERQ